MRTAVVGASGFVGRRLVQSLADQGHEVVAIGRRAEALPSGEGIEPIAADIADDASSAMALEGADAAYYLVHSMAQGGGFRNQDLVLAQSFARAARAAGVRRIVYLGALGADDASSAHLTSRHEVGDALRESGAEVVEVRAAVILGAGSISFEMMRYLVERLPVMVCPRWVQTKIQPIALRDILDCLVAALDVPPGTYEVGLDETTSYRGMMDIYADVRGLMRRRILDVPLLTLRLSSYWVDLVAPVDRRISHSLIESLASEVTVSRGGRVSDVFGVKPMGLHDAIREALDDQLEQISRNLFSLPPGLTDGVYVVRTDTPLSPGTAARVAEDLRAVGGDLSWYGAGWAWNIRMWLGALVGEDADVYRPDQVVAGERVDWWVVEESTPLSLVLRTAAWKPGESWLGYRISEDGTSLRQVAALRPRGVPGLLYWGLLSPVHRPFFAAMARSRVERAAEAQGDW